MRSRFGILSLLCAIAFAQTGSKAKVDECGGLHPTIHDCHCSIRTDAIRQKIWELCRDGSKEDKQRDACLKKENIDHCSMAERTTKWDDPVDGSDYIEGDDVKSTMGEFCKHACKPHHCACTEESCDFK